MANVSIRTLSIPKSLHEVFGEQQPLLAIVIISLFASLGSVFIYLDFASETSVITNWRLIIAFIIIADILAGFLANFTRGTNNFYACRPKKPPCFYRNSCSYFTYCLADAG